MRTLLCSQEASLAGAQCVLGLFRASDCIGYFHCAIELNSSDIVFPGCDLHAMLLSLLSVTLIECLTVQLFKSCG